MPPSTPPSPSSHQPSLPNPPHSSSTDPINLHDPLRPFNWPLRRKWLTTLLACYVTFIVSLNATSVTTATTQTNTYFHISDTSFPHSFWPVTSWTFGAALAPMFALPVMENHGVRPGYLLAYTVFTIFVIPQALARKFETLVVVRFIAGAAAGVLQDSTDGIVADIWPDAVARSLPVTCYVFALLGGVTFGSVLGGAVTTRLDWRWIFWVQLILYVVSFPVVVLGMRETRYHVILRKRGAVGMVEEESKKGIDGYDTVSSRVKEFVKENLVRPFYLLFTEPVVFTFTLLTALSYGLVFLSTVSVYQVYTTLYDWPESSTGLVQISIFIGMFLGFLVCLYQNHIFARAFEANKIATTPNLKLPEVRLYLLIPGSFVGLAGGLFWYAWTSYAYLHWILPTIGFCLIGAGSMIVMTAIMMYLTDSYAKYASSAAAAACFGENVFAAFLPLAALSLYTNLGFQWASSLIAFIALVLSIAPIVLVWKGESIRRRSRFMAVSAYD